MAPPFRQAEFQIMYGEGTNHLAEVIDIGVDLDLVGKAGAWYSYKGEKIGQGKANSVKHLIEHPEMAEEIEALIREEKLGNKKELLTNNENVETNPDDDMPYNEND